MQTSGIQTLKYWGLPILGGCLYALGNVGWALWPLAFVCMIPLWKCLDTVARPSIRSAFIRGLIFGMTIYLIGFSWLFSLSEQFIDSTATSIMLWLAIGGWFALGYGIYAATYRWLIDRNCPHWACSTLPLILLECYQINLFPTFLGTGLVHQYHLAQLASFGGPLILSALVLFINWQIYRIITRPSSTDLATPVSKICVVLIASFLFSQLQSPFQERPNENSEIKVGLVQNNVVKTSQLPKDRYSHKLNLALSRELLEQENLDLLIWPESSYNRALRRPLPLDAQMIREDIKTPLLFGGTSSFHYQGRAASTNSIFLADTQGKIEQVYDKQLLLPFGEHIPGLNMLELILNMGLIDWLPALRDDYLTLVTQLFPWHQSFKAGPNHEVLSFQDINIATPICFELAHPDYVRQLIHKGQANLLVSIANDAWFGRSQEPAIHLSLARLRAIEHGLWLVRATNSGYSAIIDPNGNIVVQTDLFEQAVLSETVSAKAATTLYTRYGNWVAWLAGVMLIIIGLKRVYILLLQHLSLLTNR